MRRLIGKIVTCLILTVIAAIFLLPFYITLLGSFKSYQEIFLNIFGLPESWSLTNYTEVVQKIDFLTAFRNSFVITAGSLCGIVLFSSMTAYRLLRIRTRLHRALYFLFVASMVIPFPALMLPLVRIMSTINLYNNLLGVIFAYYGFGTALAVVLFYGFLKTVPASMEEAAMVDGCSHIGTFFRIVMPMLKPTTATLVVLDIIWIWNDYLLPAILLTRTKLHTVPLAISYLFDQFNSRWDLAMAAVVLCIVPVLIVFLAFQKYIIAGIATGSVKG